MSSRQYKLHYFNLRALAEPSRLLLSAAKIDFEDIRIEFQDWPKIKPTCPWGKVPFLEDGDLKISQSTAILKYLASKHGFAGENYVENAILDEYVGALQDFQEQLRSYGQEQDEVKKAEKKKKLDEEQQPLYLGKFNALLENKKFLMNEKVTYADFYLAHILQNTLNVVPNFLDGYPNLQQHQETIFSLDGVKQWVEKRPKTQW